MDYSPFQRISYSGVNDERLGNMEPFEKIHSERMDCPFHRKVLIR